MSFVGVSPALAQAPDTKAGPSPADKETARTLFIRGDELFRAKDYTSALKAFYAADEIMGVPTTGLEYARTLMMLGRLLEARDGFIKVANSKKMPDELEPQQEARDEAAALAEELASRIPSVRVEVANAPEDATVKLRIDNVDIPPASAEFPRKADPGEHTVEVLVEGFKLETHVVELSEKEERVLKVTLVPTSGADSFAGDGTNPDEEGNLLPLLSWVGFSVGAAGLLIGVPTGIVAFGKESDLRAECGGTTQCPSTKQDDLDSAKTIAHVSTFGFVLGGVGIAVGVAGLLLRSELPDALANTDAPVTLHPFIGAGTAGFTGRF